MVLPCFSILLMLIDTLQGTDAVMLSAGALGLIIILSILALFLGLVLNITAAIGLYRVKLWGFIIAYLAIPYTTFFLEYNSLPFATQFFPAYIAGYSIKIVIGSLLFLSIIYMNILFLLHKFRNKRQT